MTRIDVIREWKAGRPAANSTGSLWTDGRTLFSYRLPIGTTDRRGFKVAFPISGRHGRISISATTSTHVGLAITLADRTASQEAARLMVGAWYSGDPAPELARVAQELVSESQQ